MAKSDKKISLLLLIIGLIVGGGIGYFTGLPKEPGKTIIPTFVDMVPLPNVSIKLGYIASDTTALEVGKPYHEQIIAADLNAYSKILGFGTTFTYLVDDAQGRADTHLDKVQGFKALGVTVFEGGGWSSQADLALSYCNTNGMLMWSASSTSPVLAIADDNLFRMCPADSHLVPAQVNVMWATGVRSIVLFQRGNSWGDGIVNILVPLWIAKGGVVAGDRVRYETNATNFTSYLATADKEVGDAVLSNSGDTQKVALVIVALNEISPILTSVSNGMIISSVHWWWCNDGNTSIQSSLSDARDEASQIGVNTLLTHVDPTPLYAQLQSRYENLTKQQFNAYQAYSYDISLVISNSMYQTLSTSGAVLVPLQKPTSDRTFGSTGSCRLDEFGDRISPNYDVWAYYIDPTSKEAVHLIIGKYNPDAEEAKEGEGTVLFPTGPYGPSPIGP